METKSRQGYLRPEFLILDDFGLKPLSLHGSEDLYDVINRCYEHGSSITDQEPGSGRVARAVRRSALRELNVYRMDIPNAHHDVKWPGIKIDIDSQWHRA